MFLSIHRVTNDKWSMLKPITYRTYSDIFAAGLAFQPYNKVGISREACIFERLEYFSNALKSSQKRFVANQSNMHTI